MVYAMCMSVQYLDISPYELLLVYYRWQIPYCRDYGSQFNLDVLLSASDDVSAAVNTPDNGSSAINELLMSSAY